MPLTIPTLLSRKAIVPWIAVCLTVSAIAIPLAAHLPRWVETEIVFGAWWVIWVAVLSWLLFHGHAVDDDNSGPTISVDRSGAILHWLWGTFEAAGCAFGDGCAYVFLVVLAALLVALAAVVLVELLIPAIAILLLASIGGMLARAVNDSHHCQGRIGPSLVWGTLWATLYVGPIAAAAIWISAFLSHRV